MKIKIVCVGSVKEKFYKDAILEYQKRISKYAKLEIVEVKEESISKESRVMSLGDIAQFIDKEGKRILDNIHNDYVITLEILGKMIDSVELSHLLDTTSTYQASRDICFVIGGSYGLSDEVKKRSDYALSFSKMTFPHQLMRVILVEQIYRAFKIWNKEIYHK